MIMVNLLKLENRQGITNTLWLCIVVVTADLNNDGYQGYFCFE